MDSSHHSDLRVAVARVALRLVWTATIRDPSAAFRDSQIVWNEELPPKVLTEHQAAVRLAVLTPPHFLGGDEHGNDQLQLVVNAPRDTGAPSGQPPRALDFLQHIGQGPVMILAAGRAYRLSPDAVHLLVQDYRFAVPLGGAGGPPEDPWTEHLGLPARWLEGCGFVWLAGRQEGNSMSAPMRLGEGWNEDNLVIV